MDFLLPGTTVRLRTAIDIHEYSSHAGAVFLTIPVGTVGVILKTDLTDNELSYYVRFDLTGTQLLMSQVDVWVFRFDIEVVEVPHGDSVEGLKRRVVELQAAVQQLAEYLDEIKSERDIYLSALQRLGYSAQLAGQIAREDLAPVLVHQAEYARQFILGANDVWIAVGVYDVHIDPEGYVDVWEAQAEDDAPISTMRLGK